MNISCIHCGEGFSITAEQLGKRGKCPHCKATIILPKSHQHTSYQQDQIEPPKRYLENMFSGFITVIVHLLVLIVLALIPWGDFSEGDEGEGEQILIGQLSKEMLVDNPDQSFDSPEIENPNNNQPVNAFDEEMFSPSINDTFSDKAFDLTIPSMAGGAQQAFEIQSLENSSVLAGGGEDFGQMISRLKKDGFDIVIAFDSTASMGGEIEQVKGKIQRIGNVLLKLIPKTRIGICTYRDVKDEYVVKGIELTDNLPKVVMFLEGIRAAGGGDVPEAVDEGLYWAINKNRFRRRARKVILLFGDAPPHANKLVICQQYASDFRKSGGVISTVTCRADKALPEFVSIAKGSGGEAFLTRNEREIMTQLMVLVFGSQHRNKVVQAFDLMNQ